jgi:serine/threonine protein kinase
VYDVVLSNSDDRLGVISPQNSQDGKKVQESPQEQRTLVTNLLLIPPGNSVYIVMEYCDGGDFEKLISSHKRLREGQVRQYFYQLMKGLCYLREQSILHRDLKPANLLLTNNKNLLKIADFGFARQLGEEDLLQTFCGTPLYMAPELYTDNSSYTCKSDLWSVGVILYQSLFGRPPFSDARNSIELVNLLRTRQITFPKNIQVSNECLDLLTNLLQKDYSLRISWVEFYKHIWWNKVVPNSAVSELYKDEYKKQQAKIDSVNKPLTNEQILLPTTSAVAATVIENLKAQINNEDGFIVLDKQYRENPATAPINIPRVSQEKKVRSESEPPSRVTFSPETSFEKPSNRTRILPTDKASSEPSITGISISPLIVQSYLQMRSTSQMTTSNPEFRAQSTMETSISIVNKEEKATEIKKEPPVEGDQNSSYLWTLWSSVANIWSRPSISEM